MTVIETHSLSKRYPGVTALDRLTVDIGPGVTGLVGANGAGKSTLIKILLGLAPASDGSTRVLGRDSARDGSAIRERVGYMPEHDCLPPDVSATEFVVHMARMSGLPRTAARERTADTLRHVGLYEERYRPIGGYSTGMKQRVKLAQALVHDPELVLLDEPTNGLDPAGRDEMLGLIRRVHTDFGISVLVTSHLLGELERTCDHIVVIDGGKLLSSQATTGFTATIGSLAVEVTDTDAHPNGAAALREALTAAGLTVVEEPGRRLLVELAEPVAPTAPTPASPPTDPRASAPSPAGDPADPRVTPETPPAAPDTAPAAPAGGTRDTHDLVRDTVADLGLGLVRMEQRRHRIAEVFQQRPSTQAAPDERKGATADVR